MFKDRAKFNKFLFIATPIIFGVNLGLVLLKFLGVFIMEGDYAYKMFAFATMHNPSGFPLLNLNYSLSGLIYSANIAYGVLSFVALSMIKDDEKHRSLSLAFAIVTFVLFSTWVFIALSSKFEKVVSFRFTPSDSLLSFI